MPRAPKIDRNDILAAALALVDAEGVAGLSMRRLGQRLGVQAMSLYHHMPDKHAILDAVHEAVLAQLDVPRRTGHWRRDARALARAFRRVLLAHPHAVPLFAERPAITPGSLVHVERALELLRPGFPSLKDRVTVVQVVVAYVVGHVAQSLPRTLQPPSYAALDPGAFPNLAELEPTLEDYDVNEEFEFGLAALLHGVMARPRRRGQPRSRRKRGRNGNT